eukprot:3423551-Karenia_brevis.AAC.1
MAEDLQRKIFWSEIYEHIHNKLNAQSAVLTQDCLGKVLAFRESAQDVANTTTTTKLGEESMGGQSGRSFTACVFCAVLG